MDFKHLKTFRCAASTLNFSEAAQQLNYVQSAVTAHIRALESELKVRLFDRNGRRVSLTAAGIQLLHYTDQLFALREEAEHALKQKQSISGSLTIAGYESIITYRLPKLIRQFIQQYPDVELGVTSISTHQLTSQVTNHQVDVAFILGDERFPSNLEKQLLLKEDIILITAPDHPLTNKSQVHFQDLEDETIIFTEPFCNYRKLFEKMLNDGGVFPRKRMEFISLEAIKSCVKLGMGIAAVSKVAIQRELASQELVALNWVGPTLSVELNMVWNNKRWLSPATKAFLEMSQTSILQST